MTCYSEVIIAHGDQRWTRLIVSGSVSEINVVELQTGKEIRLVDDNYHNGEKREPLSIMKYKEWVEILFPG